MEECTANPADIKKALDAGENDYEACPLYEFRAGKNPMRKGLGGHGKSFLASKPRAHGPIGEKGNHDSAIDPSDDEIEKEGEDE